jgi:flagellar hook protein FlgE
MGLNGAMSSGVSGLNAQSTSLSISGDNIANSTTVGFKSGQAVFSTLVTTSGPTTTYSSGGVNARNRQLISKQGLIQATGEASDLAISGNGFFVVNSKPEGDGDTYYTRAGTFQKNEAGTFVNAAGFTLMGWRLDGVGRLPGEAGNLNTTSSSLLSSLEPVNVRQVSGIAAATTLVEVGINLDAREVILEGSGQTIQFDATSPTNIGIAYDDVIVPYATGAASQLVDGDQITLTPSNPGITYTYTYGGFVESNDISNGGIGILGASTPIQQFIGASEGDNFTITCDGTTLTFTYTTSTPDATSGEFNTLSNLASAIKSAAGTNLTARVYGNYLYISPRDATLGMTFADVTGTFANDLGLTNTAAASNRFATLDGLNELINATASLGVSSRIESPTSYATLTFYADDPLGTLTVGAVIAAGQPVGPPIPTTTTTILDQFGLSTTTFTFGPAYDPTDDNQNIAGGEITAHNTTNVTVYDALGIDHNFNLSFVKIDENTWGIELYAADPSELTSTSRTDGLIVYGTVVFNGDGTLRSVSSDLTNAITINWANGAATSSLEFDWGNAGSMPGTTGATIIGDATGLRQFGADYDVQFIDQNGVAPGLLTSIEIDKEGYVYANFSNGQSTKVYRLPLADFANPNGLIAYSGNVYGQSIKSGPFNLKFANASGMGDIQSSALEQANVETSDELTNMIKAQRSYQACAKVIKVVNEMFEDLNRATS